MKLLQLQHIPKENAMHVNGKPSPACGGQEPVPRTQAALVFSVRNTTAECWSSRRPFGKIFLPALTGRKKGENRYEERREYP